MIAKGVLHVHSTFSYDGKVSLEKLRDLFVANGLSFCCLSEHTDYLSVAQAQQFAQQCRALSTGTFVFIPGFEVPYDVQKKNGQYKNAHILLYGTEVFLAQKANELILKQWSSTAALTVLAHPVRNAFEVDQTLLQVLDGVEIWNQQYEGKRVPRPRSVRLLRALQKKVPQLLATGGLDFHRVDHLGSPVCTMEVSVLTRASIISALQSGAYTFGTTKVSVSSLGMWQGNGSFVQGAISTFSIATIMCGKKVNALLAYFGIPLPKTIVRFIRKRV